MRILLLTDFVSITYSRLPKTVYMIHGISQDRIRYWTQNDVV